ncbi:beta-lactamase class A [Catalinimonas alkaloidigena]|uniref:serine hydrolase n=1 Tax=Catalinimonas alkaloidigena TaxID=1075417 RepID=UPI002405925C|nr:serine hydrolase [Catalinimonas alkaloidigena]MDF9800329.1 beta-lactamase class A [Catalinimonas alkaloidigena]
MLKFFCPAAALLLFILAACKPTSQEEKTLNQLSADIEAELTETEGTFAVAFKNLQGQEEELLINAKENFHAASTMKTPVLLEVYKQAEAGKFSLDDSLTVKNEFKSIVDSSLYSLNPDDDSYNLLYEQIGEQQSIGDLTYNMIIASSNLATNIVIELVGADNTTQSMRELGADDIQVLRGVEDTKAYRQGLSNTTTAYDLMVMFEAIAKGEAVSQEASEEMIDILLDQKFNKMIPAKLPEDVKVAHKTGWITGVHHDSGIVFLPDGRKYVLVLLSKELSDEEAGVETLATVSKMIYDYVQEK